MASSSSQTTWATGETTNYFVSLAMSCKGNAKGKAPEASSCPACDHPDSRAGQDSATSARALMLADWPFLEDVLERTPRCDLPALARVSRFWSTVARQQIVKDVRLETTEQVQSFLCALEAPGSQLGQIVRGFTVTKANSHLLPTLPTSLPNLRSLTLSASTHLGHLPQADRLLAELIAQWHHLRHLTIVGQDARTRRRRRFDEHEPEGEVGRCLRAMAAAGAGKMVLQQLRVLNTPLKLSTVDYFLEAFGRRLTVLDLDGCGIGEGLVQIVAQWCPQLQDARLDSLSSFSRPASTPRPLVPAFLEDAPSQPWGLASRLTTMHLSSMPCIDPACLSTFATEEFSSLKYLSLSHCDLTSVHLSFFAYITRLRIVACPEIRTLPIFTDPAFVARGLIGPGCKELRQLSLLGAGSITLTDLWQLVMLGLEEMPAEELARRSRLGLGRRGVKKITIDAADVREQLYTVQGVSFTLPANLGSQLASASSLTMVPLRLPVSAPPHLLPFMHLDILSKKMPSLAILQSLSLAIDLDEISLFGNLRPASVDEVLPEPRRTRWEQVTQLVRSASGYAPNLCWLPLHASQATWRYASAPFRHHTRHGPLPPEAIEERPHPLSFLTAASSVPVPSSPLSLHGKEAQLAGKPFPSIFDSLPSFAVEPKDNQEESNKRLSALEIEWLAQSPRLIRAYV